MLLTFKRKVVNGFAVVADVAGLVLSVSGASVVAVLGKLMLAVVLGAIALGFFLRLAGCRRSCLAGRSHKPAHSLLPGGL